MQISDLVQSINEDLAKPIDDPANDLGVPLNLEIMRTTERELHAKFYFKNGRPRKNPLPITAVVSTLTNYYGRILPVHPGLANTLLRIPKPPYKCHLCGTSYADNDLAGWMAHRHLQQPQRDPWDKHSGQVDLMQLGLMSLTGRPLVG